MTIHLQSLVKYPNGDTRWETLCTFHSLVMLRACLPSFAATIRYELPDHVTFRVVKPEETLTEIKFLTDSLNRKD